MEPKVTCPSCKGSGEADRSVLITSKRLVAAERKAAALREHCKSIAMQSSNMANKISTLKAKVREQEVEMKRALDEIARGEEDLAANRLAIALESYERIHGEEEE